LSYEYDQEGLHELKQRELKRKLEVLKEVDKNDFKTGGVKLGESGIGTRTQKDDELIRKAPNGNFIMHKSNFDFLEKPDMLDNEEVMAIAAEA